MAKLTLADAARVAGVSRVTLHRYIKAGKLRQQPDGRVDTADLTKAGFSLQPETLRAPKLDLRATTSTATPATPVTLVSGSDYQERYVALLEQQVEWLHREIETAREDARKWEQVAREREVLVSQMLQEQLHLLQQMQHQQQRLLEASPPVSSPSLPVAPAQSPVVVLPVTDLAAIPPAWQCIIDYLRSVNRAVTTAEIQQALGLAQTPRHMLHRMVHRGVVRRVAPGVFGLEG